MPRSSLTRVFRRVRVRLQNTSAKFSENMQEGEVINQLNVVDFQKLNYNLAGTSQRGQV
jgi:hypothetical protein